VTSQQHGQHRRRSPRVVLGGLASTGAMSLGVGIGGGQAVATSGPSAVLALGVLTAVAEAQPNPTVVSRDAAGRSLSTVAPSRSRSERSSG